MVTVSTYQEEVRRIDTPKSKIAKEKVESWFKERAFKVFMGDGP